LYTQGTSQEAVLYFPAPGQLTKLYQDATITFSYPDNWEIVKQETTAAGATAVGVAAPNGARELREGGTYILCGAWISFLPIQGEATRLPLEELNERIIRRSIQNEQRFGPTAMMPGSRRLISVGGQRGIIQSLVTSFQNMPEHDWVATVRVANGVWIFSLGAPDLDSQTYEPTVLAMLGSVRFPDLQPKDLPSAPSTCEQVVNRIVDRLQKGRYKLPPFRVLITNKQEMNAYAHPGYNVVEIPTPWCDFFAGDEGELAFTIAHELGHLVDKEYATQRMAQAQQQSLLGRVPLYVQRQLESRADEIGLKYIIGGGYNPYDAAAQFGRLLMFSGQTGVLEQLVGKVFSTHPVDNDRIANFRRTLIRYCQENAGACH
jgi:hypothetical protein